MATIFADDNFKCSFLNENDRFPREIRSQESNWQKDDIGSVNDLAPKRRQANTWINDAADALLETKLSPAARHQWFILAPGN